MPARADVEACHEGSSELHAKAIIQTGEFTGYTNIIITEGCAY